MNVLKRVFTVLQILFFLSMFSYTFSFGTANKPVNPIIYAGSSGNIELYWFYPDTHKKTLGNIRDYADDGLYISEQDRQYAVLTRFPLTPPAIITSISTYITDRDVFPDEPGDQFTPIGLSIKERKPNGDFIDYFNQLIYLDSGATCGGEVVTRSVNICLENKYEIWAGLEWQYNFPTAPLIGVSYAARTLEQYVCPMIDSTSLLDGCNEEFMIGMKALQWTENNNGCLSQNNVDTSIYFKIYFAIDTNDFFSSSVLLDSVGIDSLFSGIDIPSKGYLRIMALDNIDSSISVDIFVDPDKLPSISIQPQRLIGIIEECKLNSFSFNIQNTGIDPLFVQLDYNDNLMALSSDSLSLAAGENTVIEITPNIQQITDSAINTSLMLFTSDNGYPQIYHILFKQSETTDIQEANDFIPDSFCVGQPHPNPFNGTVCFNIERDGKKELSLDIYNILGQNVHSEILSPDKSGGINWDGLSQSGRELSSGVYFFRFSSENYIVYRKAIFLK